MKSKNGAVEKNIYLENRNGALRFVVQVAPLPKSSATFDKSEFNSGLAWARRRRLELLGEKARKPSPENVFEIRPVSEPAVHAHGLRVAPLAPADVLIRNVIERYRAHELNELSGAEAAGSRLNRLEGWFGEYRIGQLSEEVIKAWARSRKLGLLGPGRARIPAPKKGHASQSKCDRAKARKAGKDVCALEYAPVSTQTVRHELMLLRRAVKTNFEGQGVEIEAWVSATPLMKFKLPPQAAPRSTRLDDYEFKALTSQLDCQLQIAYLMLAIATTLRRGELCSLRWEDVDFTKSIVKLRAPGHIKKTKIQPRDVPLLPGALDVLRSLERKESGLIFGFKPASITQAIRRAADRAGLRDFRPHDLRREGISRLVELFNASTQIIRSFSGHGSEASLERHYVRPNPTRIAETLGAHPMADKMLPS